MIFHEFPGNELAGKFSKTIDYDDWYVTPDSFKMLIFRQWGVATIGLPQKKTGKQLDLIQNIFVRGH